MREVVISKGQDGYWVAECPSLPGCISQGETREDTIDLDARRCSYGLYCLFGLINRKACSRHAGIDLDMYLIGPA